MGGRASSLPSNLRWLADRTLLSSVWVLRCDDAFGSLGRRTSPVALRLKGVSLDPDRILVLGLNSVFRGLSSNETAVDQSDSVELGLNDSEVLELNGRLVLALNGTLASVLNGKMVLELNGNEA